MNDFFSDDFSNNYVSLSDRVSTVLPKHVDIDAIIEAFDASFEQEISDIIDLRDTGQAVIPETSLAQLRQRGFSQAEEKLIRQRGCVIVRGTVSGSQAEQWNQSLEEYLRVNRYYEELNEAIEQGSPRAKHPNMLDIYWSRTQLEIRQSPDLLEAIQHLNTLWTIADEGTGSFNPQQTYSYADRVRIRQPGDEVHGLSPHVDSCSLEAWFNSQTIWATYQTLLNGDWSGFNPFDAVNRVQTERKPYKESCGMFRTYQGWMALTPQGTDCGTLQLVPSSRCVAWMFFNMLQSSRRNEEQVSPIPSEAYILHQEKHAKLIKGLCSLPDMLPGDTVWWHPDVVHAVEHTNRSDIPSTVAYIGAAPDCQRNRDYASEQFARFKNGLSPPDFPATHIETDYLDRGTQEHLSELGAQQMGVLKN